MTKNFLPNYMELQGIWLVMRWFLSSTSNGFIRSHKSDKTYIQAMMRVPFFIRIISGTNWPKKKTKNTLEAWFDRQKNSVRIFKAENPKSLRIWGSKLILSIKKWCTVMKKVLTSYIRFFIRNQSTRNMSYFV